MKYCPVCMTAYNDSIEVCGKCGIRIPPERSNHCTNRNCQMCKDGYQFPPDIRYCTTCGKPTEIGKSIEDFL